MVELTVFRTDTYKHWKNSR